MARTVQVTMDCSEPRQLAEFWASVLGYEVEGAPEGWASWEDWAEDIGVPFDELEDGSSIVDPTKEGMRIVFLRVPEAKHTKNRLHLDVDVSRGPGTPLDERRTQIDAEVRRLIGLGAERLEAHELADHYHVVMRDPEGNEFCLR